jgi:hypothetical protein
MISAVVDAKTLVHMGRSSRQRAMELFSARAVAWETLITLIPTAELELDDTLALAS